MSETKMPPIEIIPEIVESAYRSKSWPFEEARKIVKRLEKSDGKDSILFQTGYGPSGLPHIGTFGEVVRTEMVRHAFRVLTKNEIPTKLLCYSDDMDGFRKVPINLPNQELLAKYLNKPLTKVPDPYGKHEGFAQGNNARLRSFLDSFGFDYEFASSTEYYESGRLDHALLRMLEEFDKILSIILPTLGEERQTTYSPFLPICPRTGNVLQVPVIDRNVSKGTITYMDPETNDIMEVSVTGGNVKCQWKADWALRWYALEVDYEMSGKDLIESVKQSTRICRALGRPAPEGFNYELFLDEEGHKISKSVGNGLTIEEWLKYASPESLSLFMYQKPKTAKRLYFDVIPKAVDEYFKFLGSYEDMPTEKKLDNPVWHIHSGDIPPKSIPFTFAMLLNLVSASNASDEQTLWGFIERYSPGVTKESNPELDKLVTYALRYFNDFILPKKEYRQPDEVELAMLGQLDQALSNLSEGADSDTIQTALYDVGRCIDRYQNKEKPSPDGRPGVALSFFSTIYQLLLGQERGPRFGSFVALYGIEETRTLIQKALSGKLVAR